MFNTSSLTKIRTGMLSAQVMQERVIILAQGRLFKQMIWELKATRELRYVNIRMHTLKLGGRLGEKNMRNVCLVAVKFLFNFLSVFAHKIQHYNKMCKKVGCCSRH